MKEKGEKKLVLSKENVNQVKCTGFIEQLSTSTLKIGYLVLGLVTLAFSVFMESAFHWAVLAISSDMLTTEGSTLKNKHTFWLVFSTYESINNVILITYVILAFINLKVKKKTLCYAHKPRSSEIPEYQSFVTRSCEEMHLSL